MAVISGSRFIAAAGVNFNGTDEYAQTDDPTWEGHHNGAIEFVHIPNTILTTQSAMPIMSLGIRSGATNASILISQRYRTTVGHASIDFFIRESNGAAVRTALAAGVALVTATPYHIVIVADDPDAHVPKIYINGVDQTLTAWNGVAWAGGWWGDVAGNDTKFVTGALYQQNAIASYGDGRTKEIRIYESAPTSAEVTWLYNSGNLRNPLKHPTLAAKLHEVFHCGTSRDDASGIKGEINGNDLAFVNMDASNYE